MLKRLNKILPELLMGIAVYGVLAQITGIWLTKDKLSYSIGLWIGILLAMGMAVHMAVVIEDAVSLNSSQGRIITMSLLRYVVVAGVFFCIIHFRFGNPIAAFVGVMGLKIAAYMQPFLHKTILKLQGREEKPTEIGEEIKDDI